MKKIFTLLIVFITLHLQAQVFTNYTTADGLINNAVLCVAVDQDDHLWFGTQEGLSHFDGADWTNYDVNSHPDLVHNTITAVAVDADNNLWAGTDFGVNKFDGTNWTTYTEADGLADNRVKYIRQSADGKIWIANNDGISILDGTSWTSFTQADGLPFGGANFVTFDTDGNAWLGTPLGGVLVFDGTNFTAITESEGLLSNKIRSIAIDENHQKWIGTGDGITVLDANNDFLTHHEYIFELPPPDKLNPVEDIQIDLNGRIWVGVYVDYLVTVGGVSMFDGGGWIDYDVDDGLVGPVVRRLAIDGKNNVWVATSTGVSKIGEGSTPTIAVGAAQKINIFPNPAQEHLTIDFASSNIRAKHLQIFNALGVSVFEGQVYGKTELDVVAWSSGVYFIKIDNEVEKILVH